MMEPGVPRVLEFGQPRHAVHIKLTGPFWEALQNAQRTGQKVTMNLGGSNVRRFSLECLDTLRASTKSSLQCLNAMGPETKLVCRV